VTSSTKIPLQTQNAPITFIINYYTLQREKQINNKSFLSFYTAGNLVQLMQKIVIKSLYNTTVCSLQCVAVYRGLQ